ncbi:MAG: ArsR/SmtB family transcription factor [Promethearchaeota archaeon]
MLKRKTIYELVNAFEVSFDEILAILKAIANNKRITILISLLTGQRSFADLKEDTKLQKTALSNHLTILIDSSLISRPDYNKYQLTSDGELFLRSIEIAFKKSEIREKIQTEGLQRRQFSEAFIKSFFGRE